MPDRAGRPRGILAVVAVLQSGTQKLAKALKTLDCGFRRNDEVKESGFWRIP
jgi:hypothetical protein